MKPIDISTPKYPNTFTMVDDADFDWLNQWKWNLLSGHRTSYVTRKITDLYGKPKAVYMHRLIMKAVSGVVVDHIDGHGLNNQRGNLRICTINENNKNMRKPSHGVTSKFKGVSWDSTRNKFQAHIHNNGFQKNLGRYDNEMCAANAYNESAKALHGKFARLNDIPS